MIARASAPGSSANLGPGFDVLAIAFDLRCRVEAEAADGWLVTENGETYEPAPDSLVRRAGAVTGDQPLHVSIFNDIPRARGLGSSAALATAVAAAASRAVGTEPTSDRLFALARGLEGHDDNAAAAVFGGCVVAMEGVHQELGVHPDLVFVVGIPATPLETAAARQALGAQVPRAAAARSLGRVVFLVEGLRTGSAAALAAAGGDELHEGPRAALSPITGALISAAMTAGALHASWSGAGPTALAITDAHEVNGVESAMAEVLDGDGTTMVLDISVSGWE